MHALSVCQHACSSDWYAIYNQAKIADTDYGSSGSPCMLFVNNSAQPSIDCTALVVSKELEM